MAELATFHLPKWLEGRSPEAKYVLGGSAAPTWTLEELIALSSDPIKTKEAFQFSSTKLQQYSHHGSLALRQNIAKLYSEDISPEHIVTATGTTGSNLTVFHSVLRAGDHVIAQYPTYPQLLGLPRALQCELSYWNLDPQNGWRPDVEELRKLIKPSTKMIILNNPANPTGSCHGVELQKQILDIAREHDIVVFVDEIFRPLFHGTQEPSPLSFSEYDYTKVIVTSSMSKAWGMAGLRTGWIICRDQAIMDLILNAREYTLQTTSILDETVATEVLSDRCRQGVLDRCLRNAEKGLQVLENFVTKNSDICSWVRPTAAATAFVKFNGPDGKPVDDVEFCRELLEAHDLLLTPGSLGFSDDGQQRDFRGYVRIQTTLAPEYLTEALQPLQAYLDGHRKTSQLSIRGRL